jgi:ribonuclease P/MRP protein subunit RPP40
VSYVPVPCERRELKDVHIPLLNIKPRPKVSKSDDDDNDVMDEWNRDAGALFEWIGLACLGSQRSVSICL